MDEVNRQAAQFFSLSNNVKQKYKRKGNGVTDLGWIPVEGERQSVDKPGDLKEAYDANPTHDDKVRAALPVCGTVCMCVSVLYVCVVTSRPT